MACPISQCGCVPVDELKYLSFEIVVPMYFRETTLRYEGDLKYTGHSKSSHLSYPEEIEIINCKKVC